jgi:hypothetical protein
MGSHYVYNIGSLSNSTTIVCLFPWRYNPLWLYFHSPVADFSLLVFCIGLMMAIFSRNMSPQS